MNWIKTLIISFVILLLAGVVTTVIFMTEPEASRADATKRTAMLVDVVTVSRGTYEPVIEVMGTVVPEQEIDLSPRVSGKIVGLSASFVPGGFVEEGEILLEIDPADYEAALLERESALREAMANLEVELGRQDVAKKDYELLEQSISPENRSLILREPQLNTAQARVESARAALRRAELDLERTKVRAPFNAQILEREANVGSLVSPGDDLAHLVGIDSYWVEASVPVSKLQWISFPRREGQEASTVEVRNRTIPENGRREGQVARLIGALGQETRMARVLITIPDPLALEEANAGKQPLMIGSYVETRIAGEPIESVVRLDRDYLRKNDTVWLKEDGLLRIREMDIIFRDKDFAYVRKGLEDGDQVVTTNLSTVVDGAELRLEGEGE